MFYFDDTRMTNKPSNPLPGFKKVKLITNSVLTFQNYAEIIEKVDDDALIVLDTEHQSLNFAIDKIVETKEILKKAGKKNLLGDYGQFPRSYWVPVKFVERPNAVNKANYENWIKQIKKLYMLYEFTDVVLLSLYTFYPVFKANNATRWKIYANANLALAKQFKKPIYPYLMINLHDNSRLVTQNEIKYQLSILQQQKIKGVVWFAGAKNRYDWKNSKVQNFWKESV